MSLAWAVGVNLFLSLAQAIGGLLSGSLSLIADALHNFSDAGSLIVALIARKVSKLPASTRMTFGYRRAEIIGALVNSSTLLLVGAYLIYEAVTRIFEPQEIEGWTVIIMAGLGLAVDLATVVLTYRGSKESMNIRAAYIHNISDALASVVVMISGAAVLLFEIYWVDWVATILISGYVIYYGVILMRDSMVILMQGAPRHLSVEDLKSDLESQGYLKEVHHIHLWQLDENRTFFEAHIVIEEGHLDQIEDVKRKVRDRLRTKFNITHATLEVEIGPGCQ
jgi:cobalt-zinc-cadmium efflux system protein